MSKSINVLVLSGGIVRDPQLKHFATGTSMLEFTLGFTDRNKTDGEWKDTKNYIDCKWFSPREGVLPYLEKGKQVILDGRLAMDTWKDKTTGANRSKPVLYIREIILLGSRDDRDTLAPTEELPLEEGLPPNQRGTRPPSAVGDDEPLF